jgi:hypothetical protein
MMNQAWQSCGTFKLLTPGDQKSAQSNTHGQT